MSIKSTRPKSPASSAAEPKRRRARSGQYQSKLTPALTVKLCEQLKRGHTIGPACAAVGIHRDSYKAWRAQGRDAVALREEGREVPERLLPFAEFLDATEEAILYGEWWLAEQALKAADEKRATWSAYVTILERTRRDRWRRPSQAELIDQRLLAQQAMAQSADNEITIRLAFGEPQPADADG